MPSWQIYILGRHWMVWGSIIFFKKLLQLISITHRGHEYTQFGAKLSGFPHPICDSIKLDPASTLDHRNNIRFLRERLTSQLLFSWTHTKIVHATGFASENGILSASRMFLSHRSVSQTQNSRRKALNFCLPRNMKYCSPEGNWKSTSGFPGDKTKGEKLGPFVKGLKRKSERHRRTRKGILLQKYPFSQSWKAEKFCR